MANENAGIDKNFTRSLLAVSSVDGISTVKVYADPTTHRLLVDASGVSSFFQTDTFTSTNNQTIFTASKTVAYTVGFYVNGSLQTPSTDYSVTSSVATLSSGIPSGNIVVWVYVTA